MSKPDGNNQLGPGQSRPSLAATVAELRALLDELYARFKQLLELAQAKIDALRAGDAARLLRLAGDEGRVLHKLFEAQDRRPAVLARVAHALRAVDPGARRLSEIIKKLPQPLAAQIAGKTEGLRRLAEQLAGKNRQVAAVAHGLHQHVRSIFAAVAEAGQETVGYRRDGQQQSQAQVTYLDAVG